MYFGGWTPSVLSIQEVQDILEIFPRNEKTEISFECNPEDVTSEYLSWLLELGINRLSIGVQSLNDETLKAIHRSDRASIFQALESIEFAIWWIQWTRKHSEINISINIDFILWLPFSKAWETLENIRELHERFPLISHTSVYMLEDGLYPKEWKKESISEEYMQKEYREICEYFDSLSWHHYEISSWSRLGYECRHNMWYWDHTDSIGFGLSATSYVWGKRWANSDSFAGYYRWDIIDAEVLTEGEKNLEKLIHELRTFRLHDNHFPDSVLDELERWWLIERKDGKIILTPAWIFRENTILAELAGVAQW